MAILGLVITVGAEPAAAEVLVKRLQADPRIEVGPIQGLQLPIVLELRTREEERAYWTALESMPEVAKIEVAFASVEDVTDSRGDSRGTP